MARKKADDPGKQRPSGINRTAAFARDKIVVADASDVAEYLDAHADLAAIVPAICSRARQEFGKDAELMLRVYRDPEIDDHYLSMCVRLPAYDDTIIARLEGVTDPFDADLCGATGYFLITTDLQPPRAKMHAI